MTADAGNTLVGSEKLRRQQLEIYGREFQQLYLKERLLRRDLEERNKELEQRIQEITALDRLAAIGELASGVAHELNNPLTTVVGFSQLLLEDDQLKGRSREMAQMIADEAQRTSRIVGNLLIFARHQKPQRRQVNINSVVEKALQLSEYELSANNITVETDLSSEVEETPLDQQQILQVSLNLIINARQAMLGFKGRGTLRVSSRSRGNTVQVTFADDGPGIPEAIHSRIFEPFFTTKEVGSGTGLGLSVSHGIVAQHGGRLYVESKPGRGASFVVELPVLQDVSDVSVESKEDAGKALLEERRGRILVVDDERTIREFLCGALRTQGHRVEAAEDGRAALERLREHSYDVLFLDLRMPGMGGERLYEVLMQEQPATVERLVFLTGDTVSTETHSFLDRTGRPFLAKPVRVSEVRKIAGEILR